MNNSTYWYEFTQNNSGGSFVVDEKYVIVYISKQKILKKQLQQLRALVAIGMVVQRELIALVVAIDGANGIKTQQIQKNIIPKV